MLYLADVIAKDMIVADVITTKADVIAFCILADVIDGILFLVADVNNHQG